MPNELIAIPNIFDDFPGYNCFVCSPSHQWGFRLRFFHDPDADEVVSPIDPLAEDMAGFPGVLHGGFQAMLLDEVMCWAALRQAGKMAVTARMDVRYGSTVRTGTGLTLKGKVLKATPRLITAQGAIEQDGRALATAQGTYFVPRLQEFMDSLGIESLPEKYAAYLRP